MFGCTPRFSSGIPVDGTIKEGLGGSRTFPGGRYGGGIFKIGFCLAVLNAAVVNVAVVAANLTGVTSNDGQPTSMLSPVTVRSRNGLDR